MRKFITVILLLVFSAAFAAAQDHKPQTQLSNKWDVFGGYTFIHNSGDPNAFGENEANNYNDFLPFNMNGGQAAISYYPMTHFGVTTDFSFTRKQDVASDETDVQETNSTQDYLIGPAFRYTLKGKKLSNVTLFAHQLFGASHVSIKFAGNMVPAAVRTSNASPEDAAPKTLTYTAITSAIVSGGGADIRVRRYLSIRPVQLDYWMHQGSLNNIIPEVGDIFGSQMKWSASGFRYSAGAVIHF
jgi:hypothetical protein